MSAGQPKAFEEERADIARACRILASEGLVSDILGHVSLRVGEDRMLIRARGPEDDGLLLSTSEDVVLTDFDGNPAQDIGDHKPPNELPIHGEVLRNRPDVNAVVHAHPPEVVLCSIAGLELRPVFGSFNIPAMRMADRGVPVFEYYGLIRNKVKAGEMVAAMAGGGAVVLRGHGLTAASSTLAGAVSIALNLNTLASMTAALARVGAKAPVVPEADRVDLPDLGSAFNDAAVWRHYIAKLGHAGLE